MCCFLDNIGIHLEENYPRVWSAITEYKNASKIMSAIVLIFQLVRITTVGYDSYFIYHDYPEAETIGFCTLSIILGFVSLGLESLLLYAVQKNNIQKIQPWFMCTLIIFLLASLAFVITSALYIIRPIEHHHDNQPIPVIQNATNNSITSNLTLTDDDIDNITMSTRMERAINENSASGKNPSSEFLVRMNDLMTNKAEADSLAFATIEKCPPEDNSTCRIVTGKDGAERVVNIMEETPKSNNLSTKANMTSSNKGPAPIVCPKEPPRKRKPKTIPIITYRIHPTLPLSFLLDVIRCIPQLFLVNRFVKAEQLHEHLIHPTPFHVSHSHTSLSALYVKPVPAPVLV